MPSRQDYGRRRRQLDEEPAVDIEGIVAEAVLALLKARGSHRLDQYQACCGQGMVCGGRNASEADKWPATLCATCGLMQRNIVCPRAAALQ